MTYRTDGHWINHVLCMHPDQFNAQATIREREPNPNLIVPVEGDVGGPDEESDPDESDDDAPGDKLQDDDAAGYLGHSELFLPLGAGKRVGDVPNYHDVATLLSKPWQPFTHAQEYRLARHFVRSKTSKTQIDDYFNQGLCHDPETYSFRSGHLLRELLKTMDGATPAWQTGSVTLMGTDVPCHWRNPVDCARYLLSQRAYKENLR